MKHLLYSLLCACLLAAPACSSKKDDPNAPSQPSVPDPAPAVDVTNAPTATGSGASQMQVRVTSIGLAPLQSSVVINTATSLQGASYTMRPFTYGFVKDMNQTFNVGSMAAYQQGGLVYHYDAEIRIAGASSFGAIPATANMWVELLKDGQVIETNRIASTVRADIASMWRPTTAFIYSSVHWDSH